MDDFERELKAGFLEEADQILSDLERCFLKFESTPDDKALLDEIFRLVHNIKGSSRAVGFEALGQFAHEYENLLLRLKKGEISPSQNLLNLLLKCLDFTKEFVADLRADMSAKRDFSDLVAQMAAVAEEKAEAPVESAPVEESAEMAAPQDVVEEVVSDFDRLRLAASSQEWNEGEATAPVAAPAPVPAVAAVAAPASAPPASSAPKAGPVSADESIRVSLARIEKLINYVGEISIMQAVLREQAYLNNPQTLRKTVHQLTKVTKEVQDLAMSLRMIPLKSTFQKMQRIVRDTAGLLGKPVNLVLQGEDTEVDKTVLESLGDPLVHLVRNAVDHGIESVEARRANGKSDQGTVHLRAFHRGDNLVIEVQDDGGGISTKRLIEKAQASGVLRAGQEIAHRDAVNLIFHPGLSTKAEASEISGRGVGMDVVKTNIEKLQGSIEVETEVGKGTLMRVILPLTMAIIDTLAVELAGARYIVPLAHVTESIRITPDLLNIRTGVGALLVLRGESIPLFSLGQLMGGRRGVAECQIALIVHGRDGALAVGVDDIIGQYQVVIKRLGDELQGLPGVIGCSILGDGRPSLILDLEELVKKTKGLGVVRPHERGVA